MSVRELPSLSRRNGGKKNHIRSDNKRYEAKHAQTQNLSGQISAANFAAFSIDGPATDIVQIDE